MVVGQAVGVLVDGEREGEDQLGAVVGLVGGDVVDGDDVARLDLAGGEVVDDDVGLDARIEDDGALGLLVAGGDEGVAGDEEREDEEDDQHVDDVDLPEDEAAVVDDRH